MPTVRSRVGEFTRALPQSASAAFHVLNAKIGLSKSHHGPKLWVPQNIFACLSNIGFSKYCHILGKTLCSGPMRRPGQASPWGHRPSSSAPYAVPMRLSRIGQHIKDEPCAKQRALLGIFSSRFSSISRDIPTRARTVLSINFV